MNLGAFDNFDDAPVAVKPRATREVILEAKALVDAGEIYSVRLKELTEQYDWTDFIATNS